MKILYIITQADGGGAQKYVLALAKHFQGAIAAGDEAERLFIQAQSAGLKTFPLSHLKRNISPWHDFLAIWEIRQLVKNLEPDIVHLNSTKAGILGSFACIGLKTKVLFTAHGFVFNEPLPWIIKSFYLALEKIASDYRDYIICVSEADRQAALKQKLINQDKISVIYNGISQIKFLDKTQARQNLGLPSDKFIIGCVSNFYKTKGIDVLIEAAGLLPTDVKEKIQVAIIGEGPEKEKLQATSYKLQANIKLLNKIENANNYLKAFDVFVIPSRKEGFPFALLEAMQAGLPIIASNVGGMPEALGNTGILIPPDDPTALAEAIINLTNDELKQTDLSAKALERSKLFTEEKMLTETQAIYKKLLP